MTQSATIPQPPIALGPSWLDPDVLIEAFGMLGVLAIVFIESGLLVGFFLPGDSLLFTAGLLSSHRHAAGAMGPAGDDPDRRVPRRPGRLRDRAQGGPAVFNRPESRFFHQENVDRASEFFAKHGPRTVIIARFVPIIRTFVPVMAGVSRMEYKTFVVYNAIGALLWGVGVTLLGYLLGQVQFVHDNIEPILIAIVAISLIPVAVELLRARRRSGSAS